MVFLFLSSPDPSHEKRREFWKKKYIFSTTSIVVEDHYVTASLPRSPLGSEPSRGLDEGMSSDGSPTNTQPSYQVESPSQLAVHRNSSNAGWRGHLWTDGRCERMMAALTHAAPQKLQTCCQVMGWLWASASAQTVAFRIRSAASFATNDLHSPFWSPRRRANRSMDRQGVLCFAMSNMSALSALASPSVVSCPDIVDNGAVKLDFLLPSSSFQPCLGCR